MTTLLNNAHWITLFGGVIVVIGAFLSSMASDIKSTELAKKSDQLVVKSDDLAETSAHIAGLNKDIAALNKEIAAYATGGDSYVYTQVLGFGTAETYVKIIHVGAYPVRDVVVDVNDVTDEFKKIALGELAKYTKDSFRNTVINSWPVIYEHSNRVVNPPEHEALRPYPFEAKADADFHAYFVHIHTQNGVLRQRIQFAKIDGVWRQNLIVDRPSEEGRETLVSERDEGFPADNDAMREFLNSL